MATLQTVQKIGPVLALFSVRQPEWGVSEVVAATQLSRSSAHALLSSVVDTGLWQGRARGRYPIQIEAGPDKHGISQGQFLYVFEPGYLHLDPDATTKTWQMSDIDTGLAVGGGQLTREAHFTYGTPSPLTLDQNTERSAHFGSGKSIEESDLGDVSAVVGAPT